MFLMKLGTTEFGAYIVQDCNIILAHSPFIKMKCPSLLLQTDFILKSIFSWTRKVMLIVWNTFPSFHSNVVSFLNMRWISYKITNKQKKSGEKLHLNTYSIQLNPSIFIGKLNQSIFKDTEKYVLIAVLYFCCLCLNILYVSVVKNIFILWLIGYAYSSLLLQLRL